MADGLRQVARAYYERASEYEIDEAKSFFDVLDGNEDGVISLGEFKSGYDSRPSSEEFFKKLDSNCDGVLDFGDVLVLFYHQKNAISISRCDGCNQKLFGPYFSCLLCLDHSPNTYDLCCDCHRGGKFSHHHPLKFMLHDQAALAEFVHTKTLPAPKSDMEELREIAKSHFGPNSSPETQASAKKFFNSMDSDGDGKVELSEFSSFMSQKGYKRTGTPEFFKMLDIDDKGRLDYWEVMTLYYIIKSGRPFCDSCDEFIPTTYFSCVMCLKEKTSFDICLRCYQSVDHCNLTHLGHPPKFLDNYALLHAKAKHGLALKNELERFDFAISAIGKAWDVFGFL